MIPRRFALIACCLAVAALVAAPLPSAAQQGLPVNGSRPRIFFDCQGPGCNSEYYRTEIAWVSWVRDRADAQVHVLVTSSTTGAGGREYEMAFMGRTPQGEYSDRATHTSLPTDTERETLDAITETLALGLARYANAAGYRGLVRLEAVAPEGAEPQEGLVSAEEVEDPWDLWSFRVGANGDLEGESTEQTVQLNSSLSASRVTPTWKLNYNGRINFQRQELERADSSIFVDKRTNWNFDVLMVYALADRWSMGLRSNSARMVSFNQDFRVSLTPAVEYSFFPYSEATRRALTVYYEIGPTYRNYIEETVFDQVAETRWEQSLQVRFSERQPWGDASVSLEGSHFLHDIAQRNIALRGNLSFRITRGLSIETDANVSWVNDQIYLSSEGETDEEILLRLRQRSTDFTYGASVGFSFQFGSIFNNVVNNRFRRPFGGGGGGGGDFGR